MPPVPGFQLERQYSNTASNNVEEVAKINSCLQARFREALDETDASGPHGHQHSFTRCEIGPGLEVWDRIDSRFIHVHNECCTIVHCC